MVKIGDILVGHYGYSMEIYNFYVVTKQTAKSITISEIEKKQIGGDGFRPIVTPKINHPDAFTKRVYPTGETITRRIKEGKNYVADKSGYGIIYLESLTDTQIAKGYQEDHLD